MDAVADPVQRIRSARRRLATVGPPILRQEGDFDLVSLPMQDGDVLRDLLAAENASTVIEIGLAYGASALAIAEALVSRHGAAARHLIVDAFQEQFHDSGWHTLLDAGLGTVCSLVREHSQLALPAMLRSGLLADAAFVDGSHIFHNVVVDLAFLRRLVHPGGLIVLDDCEWPSVAAAAEYFERNLGWTIVPCGRPTRLRAYRLPPTIDEPDFREFRPFSGDSKSN